MRLPILPEPDRPRISPEDRQKLADLLATGPLYKPLEVHGNWDRHAAIEHVIPDEIVLACRSKKCDGLALGWKLSSRADNITPGTCGALIYHCRNCGAAFHVWFAFGFAPAHPDLKSLQDVLGSESGVALFHTNPGTFRFEKTGQFPAPSVAVPRDLEDALKDHAILYRRGLISRNLGHGIGAHAYFRRVVEETMDEMLGLLVAALEREGADPAVIDEVRAVQNTRQFERKAEIAAKALPDRLKKHGNPFSMLHTLHSENLHAKTDEEAVVTVDQMRDSLDILFKTLKSHVSDLIEYEDAMKRFQQRITKEKS